MSGLFSTISGKFGKDLILGAFAPAVIFIALWLLLVAPLIPDRLLPFERLAALGAAWEVIAVSLAALVLTVLLHNLGTPIIRLYEGYPWRHTWWGLLWSDRFRRRFEALTAKQESLFALRSAADGMGVEGELLTAWGALRRLARLRYPDAAEHVLPTRLGNVVRAFECYPGQEYGMEAVELWPRLLPVMDGAYAESIGDARTALSFLLNLSFLSGVLAVVLLGAGAAYPPGQPVRHVLVPALVSALGSYGFYRLAVGQALAWGGLVKGAFDLYRGDMLKKLGYEHQPKTRAKEREVWGRVSRQLTFGDQRSTRAPRLDYAEQTPSFRVVPTPPEAEIEFTRSLRARAWRAHYTVVITVRNISGEPVNALTIHDHLGAEAAYAAGSARLGPGADGTVEVEGSGSYTFKIRAPLAPAHSLTLEYGVVLVPRPAGVPPL